MSSQHHQSMAEVEAQTRLVDQIMGRAKEHFQDGRLNKDDEGDLSFAIAADPQNDVILIHFGKPVTWFGLNRKSAESLRDMLTEKLTQIK